MLTIEPRTISAFKPLRRATANSKTPDSAGPKRFSKPATTAAKPGASRRSPTTKNFSSTNPAASCLRFMKASAGPTAAATVSRS